MMEDSLDYTLEDIAMMIAACVAVWGDGALSPEEHELLLQFMKQSEPEIFDRGWAEHRDPRDPKLCRLEYIVWLLEHINGLKESMLDEVQDEQKAQELAIIELCDMYRDKMVSHGQKTGMGPKQGIEYVQANKQNLFRFIEKVSLSDSKLSSAEEVLIAKVKWELGSPQERATVRLKELDARYPIFGKLNNGGKVFLFIITLFPIPIFYCWLPWRLGICRNKNQNATVLNDLGVASLFILFFFFHVVCFNYNFWLGLASLCFTWIPVKVPFLTMNIHPKPAD